MWRFALLFTLLPGCVTHRMGFGGLTYHGGEVHEELPSQMPNKRDSQGKKVVHPMEVHYSADFSSNFRISTIVLRDCFDEPAFYVGAGQQFGDGLQVGYSIGLYGRRIHRYVGEDGRSATPMSLPLSQKRGSWEYSPTMFISVGYTHWWDDFGMFGSLGSNYLLTHAQVGVAIRP
jgi:hypothetical protein